MPSLNRLEHPLVLASSSPRRQELLESLGLKPHIHPAEVDESFDANDVPYDLVARLSLAKAETVAQHYPERLIVAADTIVVYRNTILGKPQDKAQSLRFIEQLSGHTHEVLTGHALIFGKKRAQRVVQSAVRFRHLSPEEQRWYAQTGEGLDKAGGYAIQGLGASIVREVRGCYTNIVGLSLPTLVEQAQAMGIALL